MKKHLLVSPKIDLIELIGNCLLEKSRELFNNLIVFPAKRPIHFLRKYLAGKLRSSFRSPVILAIDEFVDYLYDLLGYSDVRINSLDAIALLFELNREGGLINYPGGELTIDEFLPWGAKILSDFEEIYIEAIGPEVIRSIDQIESEQLPARIRERLLTFSQLYKSFYDYLIEHHYSTRSLRYRRVAESMEKVDLEKFEQIFLAGFFMLTRSEEKIFKNISQLKNSQLIFQDGPGVDATIRSLNLAVEKIVSGNPQPVVSLYKAMDAHGQVFKLAEVISERKNFNQRDVVVLPVPDTLFPVIQHALGRIKGDYNISLGYPLYRTSIYSLIETLRQLLNTKEGEKYSLAHYLKFVLHPYIKNIRLGKMSEPTRIIFHTIEEFYQNVPRRFITLTEIENNEKLTDLCWNKLRDLFPGGPQKDIIINHLKEIHYHLIKNFENIDSLEDFGNKLLNFLSFISLHSTANRHIYTAPFVETMIGAIYELRQSFLKKVRFSKMESYFRLLRSYIRTLHHPFEGSPVQGLQVLGFLETRNIKFDSVYILDVNEGVIPQTGKSETLLPHQVRRYLRLPTYQDREKIARYYFENLLNGAKEVYIFYIENAEKEKSRFVEKILWENQKRADGVEPKTSDIFFNVGFKQKDPEPIAKNSSIISFINSRPRFSVSSIDDYLRCQLIFYYKNLLGLEPRIEIEEEIDPQSRGGLVHKILESFFIEKIGRPLVIKPADYQRMGQIIDKIFSEQYPDSERGPLFLYRCQIKRRMFDLLWYYEGEQHRTTIIRECENQCRPPVKNESGNKFYIEPLQLSTGKIVKLSGKIDRVDQRGDTIYIVDYKTSYRSEMPKEDFDIESRDQWTKTLGSIQLPAYIILYQSRHHEALLKDINACLLILGDKDIREVPLFGDKLKSREKELYFNNLKEALIRLIEEIFDPELPFLPTSEPDDNCPSCDFKVICGRQWIVGRGWR